MDYLLSNFLSWFDIISKKHSRFNSKAIIEEIEDDLPTIIPEIYKVYDQLQQFIFILKIKNRRFRWNFEVLIYSF